MTINFESLFGTAIINEETKTQIQEAWESKLNEARSQIVSEMRAEFASRYEHDKNVMVEALDKMVTESLKAEITQISEEKARLAEDRTKFVSEMTNKLGKFEVFLGENLKKELTEFATDRSTHKQAVNRLEKFVMRALAEELAEFAADKRDLVETKVKLVSEAKEKLENLQKQFISRGSKLVEATVTNTIKAELGQLKEDIKVARENNFGRRLFEAFASEFSATHLNENAEIRKLRNVMSKLETKLVESTAKAERAKSLLESRDREIAQIKNDIVRDAKLNEMLKPLAEEKRKIMASLLETVQTEKLENAFQKYLPAVINNSSANGRKAINESVIRTGNRAAKALDSTDVNSDNIVEIRRLAGLK